MRGCRALSDIEINKVVDTLTSNRDKCLFILGVKTGFRVSELLSLTIGDVVSNGVVLDLVKVYKRNTKGKVKSRVVPLHSMAKLALERLVAECSPLDPSQPLFKSRVGKNKAISRFQAHVVLKNAYEKAGVRGQVATHSMRKSFAKQMYIKLKRDLLQTQHALGHASIDSTIKYLPIDEDAINKAITEE